MLVQDAESRGSDRAVKNPKIIDIALVQIVKKGFFFASVFDGSGWRSVKFPSHT